MYTVDVADMNKHNILKLFELEAFKDRRGQEEAKEEEAPQRDDAAAPRRVPAPDRKPPLNSNDRANQEVFISQNGDRNLQYFPSDEVYKEFRKSHLPSLQSSKTAQAASKTVFKMDKKPKRQMFW